ncbi:MAG: cytochrome c biogenesis protein CcsA [Coriobacteriales bacterium]|nr:cytochrome c biogenesis protein CcsA [Coriobacteriales bacterium]
MVIICRICLIIALAALVIGIVCIALGLLKGRDDERDAKGLLWGGHVAGFLSLIALTIACLLLVFCFFSGNTELYYVVSYRSSSGWLFKLAGLWAGREGSLLFWTWLMALFAGIMAWRDYRSCKPLDSAALLVMQILLTIFVSMLVFSSSNSPFQPVPGIYLDSNGQLNAVSAVLGMNSLLEHWAMAIHPPTLFVGYAGLAVPFAYGMAALIMGDFSRLWVDRCTPYALFSWLFLGLGIGLGAIWAYVVLGWGGYWGWDPVENASLLPWILCAALIHDFTVYRQKGIYRRWTIFCAALTFAFVILGTFITRSGIVQSVHAFEGDPLSRILFLGLIVCTLLAPAVGLYLRRDTFAKQVRSGMEETQSMFSKDIAYYLNNLLMVLAALLITYLTICAALPGWMPLGGHAVGAATYGSIARPLGVFYCGLIAICPLLSWTRTDRAAFLDKAKLPAACAAGLFVLLMALWLTVLLPNFNAALANDPQTVLMGGPVVYQHIIAILAFAVASLLFFNALFMLIKAMSFKEGSMAVKAMRGAGACVAHMAMALILIGLVGSDMYVFQRDAYLPYDEEKATTTMTSFVEVDEHYQLEFLSTEVTNGADGRMVLTVHMNVHKDGKLIGQVDPAMEYDPMTQQQKLIASVIHRPTHDLFVVFRGISTAGAGLALDVRINPLISILWLGFALLMLGTAMAFAGVMAAGHRRRVKMKELSARD